MNPWCQILSRDTPLPAPRNRNTEMHAFGSTKQLPWVCVFPLWAVAALESAPMSQVLQGPISYIWPTSSLQKSLVLSWSPPVNATCSGNSTPCRTLLKLAPVQLSLLHGPSDGEPTPKPAFLTLPKEFNEAESDLPVLPLPWEENPEGHPLEAQHSSHNISATASWRRYAHNSRRICNPN